MLNNGMNIILIDVATFISGNIPPVSYEMLADIPTVTNFNAPTIYNNIFKYHIKYNKCQY